MRIKNCKVWIAIVLLCAILSNAVLVFAEEIVVMEQFDADEEITEETVIREIAPEKETSEEINAEILKPTTEVLTELTAEYINEDVKAAYTDANNIIEVVSDETELTFIPSFLAADTNPNGYGNPNSFTNRGYSGCWIWPTGSTYKKVNSYVGGRPAPTAGASTNHHGTDIDAPTGAAIYAARAGKAYVMSNIFPNMASGLGTWILIDHGDGFYTAYGHMSSLHTRFSGKNEVSVSAGDIIGYVGTTGRVTGPHLHFEIAYNWWGSGYYNKYGYTWGATWGTKGWEIVDSSPLAQNYVYSISELSPTASTLQFTNVLYPATFKINTKSGWALGSGTVESNNKLTSIQSQIINSSGTVISNSGVKSISGYSYAIKNLDTYSSTDNGVKFSKITSAGNYTWVLTAKDSGGNTLKMEMPVKAVSSGSTVTATKSQQVYGTGTRVATDAGTYKIIKETTLRKKPYDAAEKGSTLKKGTTVTAVAVVDNGTNYWLELGGNYAGQYIFSGYSNKGVKNGNQYLELSSANVKCTASSGWNLPSGNLPKGKSFELKGDFTLNHSMTKVKAEITQNGKLIASSEGSVSNNATSYSLYSSPVNTNLKFGSLPASNTSYKLEIKAQYRYDRCQKTEWVSVKSATFTVGAVSATPTPTPKPTQTVKPTSISINEGKTVQLALGSTLQLHTTLKPANASTTLTWTSANKKIVTVTSPGGIAAGVKTGSTTLTVKTANGKSAKITVKVYDPKVATSIALKESGTVELALGKTLQLNATMSPATATNKITWSSSNKKIAKVSDKGLVTPVKAGTVTVTVKTSNGKNDTVKVKVYDPKVATSITLKETGTVKLALGKTLQLHATMDPGTATNKVSWKSSNKKIAKVDDKGLITPIKAGTVTITVKTSNGKKDTVKVKVFDPKVATSITLKENGTVKLQLGKTLQLHATMDPSTATNKVSWSSSNKKIAKVDANGLVTPVKKGTVTITVKTSNGKKDTVKVKVIK